MRKLFNENLKRKAQKNIKEVPESLKIKKSVKKIMKNIDFVSDQIISKEE